MNRSDRDLLYYYETQYAGGISGNVFWGVILASIFAALVVMAATTHAGDLPDRALTPGAVYPAGEEEVCGKVGGLTYEKRSRAALTAKVKRDIILAYGGVPGQLGDHELDHLVPAALAGRSDASNVWLQVGKGHGTAWTFEVKDLLDGRVWREVCVRHTMTLEQGQALFLVPDWRASYCSVFKNAAPCPPRQ